MRSPQIGFPQLVQDFFLRRLIAQRGASARTVEAYRDAFELLLGFAERRTGKPPSALRLADLDAPARAGLPRSPRPPVDADHEVVQALRVARSTAGPAPRSAAK